MTCHDPPGLVTVKGGVMVGAAVAITVTDLVEFPGEANRISASFPPRGGGGAWEDSAEVLWNVVGLGFTYPDGTISLWSRCE